MLAAITYCSHLLAERSGIAAGSVPASPVSTRLYLKSSLPMTAVLGRPHLRSGERDCTLAVDNKGPVASSTLMPKKPPWGRKDPIPGRRKIRPCGGAPSWRAVSRRRFIWRSIGAGPALALSLVGVAG